MLQFEWLWALSFLPLPVILRLVLPPARQTQDAALRVPFIQDFRSSHSPSVKVKSNRAIFWLAVIAWILFVIAVSRPQWLGEPIELPVSGRDLMLAVDLSGSMEMNDFIINSKRVDRLTATKFVAGEFIDRRVGDRIGLILFGKQAYLQTPLTFDRETVRQLLYESVIGLAGKETAIGDAIGLAVKRFSENKKSYLGEKPLDQVLILLTDGANTAGEVEPVKAAELAMETGMKIYTIGIGADEIIVPSLFGSRRVNPSTDLDEKTLKTIAAKTKGRYFRARDTEELNKIYQLLDELEPVEQEKQSFRPHTSLYMWPLGISLLVALLILTRLTFSEFSLSRLKIKPDLSGAKSAR